MSKLRFAIVGCGRVCELHIAALERQSADAQIVAVCDPLPEAAQRIAARLKVPAFSQIEEMLAQVKADVVILCTPSGLHPAQAITAAKAGCHVISEKPMATYLEQGQAMLKACREAGVRLFVVKQNRFNPTCQVVKQAIAAGCLGRIYLVVINVLWSRPQSYYDMAKWRGTRAMDGGVFMNQASHFIDMALWLVNEPLKSVSAVTKTLVRDIECEDLGVATLEWQSGALASINVTSLVAKDDLEGSVYLVGEKGSVKLGGVALNQIETWAMAQPTAFDEQAKQASYAIDSVYGHGHADYYQDVITALKTGNPGLVEGEEGLKALVVLEAIYQSSATGQRVFPE